jgi:hypothetical protein
MAELYCDEKINKQKKDPGVAPSPGRAIFKQKMF